MSRIPHSAKRTVRGDKFLAAMQAWRQALNRQERQKIMSLDRLSREGVSATLNHLERLSGYGVNWRSYTEEYLDSGLFRDAVLSILATIAKQERVRRSERAAPLQSFDDGRANVGAGLLYAGFKAAICAPQWRTVAGDTQRHSGFIADIWGKQLVAFTLAACCLYPDGYVRCDNAR